MTELLRELAGSELRGPAGGVLLAVGVLGFFISRARYWRQHFTLFDGLMIVIAMAIGTAAGIPLVEGATQRASAAAMLENLHVLRSQIELYRAEHGGDPPLLYQGTFPQLTQATNAKGVPGLPGKKYPYGPYLPNGIPRNPIKGSSIVTSVEEVPPPAATGNGGWFYQQRSGRIGADAAAYLDR